jgi:exodeoxyribonuclease V gamma subunit
MPPRIPFSLADRSLRAELPLIEAFLNLLAPARQPLRSRRSCSAGWSSRPSPAAPASRPKTCRCCATGCATAGVRWGRDGGHRALASACRPNRPLPGNRGWIACCWASPRRRSWPVCAAPLLGDSWPLDALEGARGQLLGAPGRLRRAPGRLAQSLQRARPLADWADCLQQLIDSLFDEREAGDTLLLLSKACAALREQATASRHYAASPWSWR